MKRIGWFLLALAFACLTAFPLFAQCPNCPDGVCPVKVVSADCACVNCQCPVCVCSAAYVWTEGGREGEIALRKGGVQVGGYSYDAEVFRFYDRKNDRWSDPATPPIPVQPKLVGQAVPNFGIDTSKLKSSLDAPTYKHNGKHVSRETATDILAKGLPDDGNKLWLTVIGSDDDRKRAEADFPDDLKEKIKLNSYRPDHWAVSPGFVKDGKPTVYLQAPGGQVLHRQDDYKAGDFQAIRKAVASYNSAKDPDARVPAIAALKLATPQNLVLGGLVAAMAILYFKQRKVAV